MLAGGAVGLASLAYVGAAVHYKDVIASGTTVAGRSVGGMTREQATRQLEKLHDDTSRKATVSVEKRSFTVTPGSASRVDVEKTLAGATGFSLSPVRLWHHVSGGGETLKPTFVIDRAALQAAVKKAAGALEGAPKQGTVKFIGGRVTVVAGAPGKGVDEAAVTRDILAGWPAKTTYTASWVTRDSDASRDAVQAFAQGDAAKAMSAPLKVTANGETVTLSAAEVSDVISTKTSPQGRLSIAVDTEKLLEEVLESSTDMRVPPVEAKVVWKDDVPSVQPGRAGQKIDESSVAERVQKALVGDHHAQLAMTPDPPKVDARDIDVEALPQTSMAHFESPYPTGASQEARIHNIQTALARLNGQVVKPGEQFSLLRALGYDFTEKAGYRSAGTLQGGLHVDGMGGGVSQVSTSIYNTAFFAGVQLDEHTPHGVYIDRYPMGREATIWNPGIDNTWTNDTGHLILIKASTRGNRVVMDFYGTKKYDVSTRTSERRNIVEPKQKTVKNVEGCESSTHGTPGFDVDVYRTLKSGDTVVRTERIHTHYKPDDPVTCEG